MKPANGRRSVLFFSPDYHCSFFLRDELRKKGWVADIFVPSYYPSDLLFRDDGVLRDKPSVQPEATVGNAVRLLVAQIRRVLLQRRYQYVMFYCSLGQNVPRSSLLERLFHRGLGISLSLLRWSGTKVVYLAGGCRNQATRSWWESIDDGNVCGNCGFADRCSDDINIPNFDLVRTHVHLKVGWDPFDTPEYQQTFFRYKSFDLNLYSPDLVVPPEFMISRRRSSTVVVMHSRATHNRDYLGRDIKGSRFVERAVQQLKEEGIDVESLSPSGVMSREMRFLQVQADVVVDQLIYGTWGSTSLEALALGRPVVCYVRPSWRKFLEDRFPEIRDLPIVTADPTSISATLRELCLDRDLRLELGARGREFARQFLDVTRNCDELIRELEALR